VDNIGRVIPTRNKFLCVCVHECTLLCVTVLLASVLPSYSLFQIHTSLSLATATTSFFLGIELMTYTLSDSTSTFFCDAFFQDKVSRTVCPGWLRTFILLISASQVARITGVSHWCPAFFKNTILTCSLGWS
jgi:hypothetical protein